MALLQTKINRPEPLEFKEIYLDRVGEVT